MGYLRLYPSNLREVAFVWSSVASADDYALLVGTTPGGSERFTSTVGNVLTYPLPLLTGSTFYARVQAWQGSTCLSTSDEQTVVTT